ncbi:MFS transporter [Vigna unguiculata]|uniref:MFS transporter n=1 Tax=Vigna unguiculata TaxID=3917 RepID=A0A4D6LY25_VIGUN|nr:MFS transporter [Vigna unguiculata]
MLEEGYQRLEDPTAALPRLNTPPYHLILFPAHQSNFYCLQFWDRLETFEEKVFEKAYFLSRNSHSRTVLTTFVHLPLAIRSPSARPPLVIRVPSALFACRPRAVCELSARPSHYSHAVRTVCASSASCPLIFRAPSASCPLIFRAPSASCMRVLCAPSARTVPSIVDLLTLPFIPDSPKWLAKVGRWKECESALQRLRGKHADVYQEAAEIRVYNKFLVWFGIVWSVKSIDIETCTLTHSKPPQWKPPSSTSLYCRRNNLAGSSIPHNNADEVKVHVPNLAKTRFTFTK